MTKYKYTILFGVCIALFSALLLMGGCASVKPMVSEAPERSTAPNPAMPDRYALGHYIRALNYEDSRFYQGALMEYLQALKRDSASVVLRLGAARSYYVLKSPDSARAQVERALAIDSGSREALSLLGEILVEAGDYDRAEGIFTDLAEKYPQTVSYHSHLAAIAVTKNQPDKALEEYITIARLTGEVVEVMSRAGAVMLMRDFNLQALEIYLQLIQIAPEEDKFRYAVGVAYIRLEQPDSAAKYFESAIDINPKEPRYFLALGNLLNIEGDHQAAESIFRLGIENNPDAASLYNILGATLQRMNKYDEALETLYKSIELDSNSATPYVTIGFIYDDLGEREKAIQAYDAAMGIDSTDALILNNYAYLLAEANIRLEKARRMAGKALEAAPENSSYLDTMGWIFYRLSDFTQAEEYIRRALQYSDNPVIYLHLGEILEAAGKHAEAVNAYREGLNKNPDNPELKERMEGR